jgi:hypothetical protein
MFSIPVQQFLKRKITTIKESFELSDLLKEEKAVISLRKSPHICINYKDYDEVLQYEQEHPEIYQQPGVYEPDSSLSRAELTGFQFQAFNFMFALKKVETEALGDL